MCSSSGASARRNGKRKSRCKSGWALTIQKLPPTRMDRRDRFAGSRPAHVRDEEAIIDLNRDRLLRGCKLHTWQAAGRGELASGRRYGRQTGFQEVNVDRVLDRDSRARQHPALVLPLAGSYRALPIGVLPAREFRTSGSPLSPCMQTGHDAGRRRVLKTTSACAKKVVPQAAGDKTAPAVQDVRHGQHGTARTEQGALRSLRTSASPPARRSERSGRTQKTRKKTFGAKCRGFVFFEIGSRAA